MTRRRREVAASSRGGPREARTNDLQGASKAFSSGAKLQAKP